MKSKKIVRRQLMAAAITILGPMFVLLAVYTLNRMLLDTEPNRTKEPSRFQVMKPPQPKVRREPKPKPKPKRQQNQQDLAPDLSQMISGSSFGLQNFEWLDKDSLSESLVDDIRNATMTADTVDQPPVVMQRPPLEYPPQARKKGISGYVTVSLLVTPGGQVEKAQVTESVPQGTFDQVALTSVKQWRFQPAEDKGKRVAVWVEQKISFSLN
jgi:protein TonB